MATRYEYLVVQTQDGRVTFFNGKWMGKKRPQTRPKDEAFESCPWEWTFLNDYGKEAWELCGTTTFVHQDKSVLGLISGTGTNAQRLYLRRAVL